MTKRSISERDNGEWPDARPMAGRLDANCERDISSARCSTQYESVLGVDEAIKFTGSIRSQDMFSTYPNVKQTHSHEVNLYDFSYNATAFALSVG